MIEAKTIDIRIPVLVDDRGRWATNGWDNDDGPDADWQMMDESIDINNPLKASRKVWVLATVSLPEVADETVAGTVDDNGETK